MWATGNVRAGRLWKEILADRQIDRDHRQNSIDQQLFNRLHGKVIKKRDQHEYDLKTKATNDEAPQAKAR